MTENFSVTRAVIGLLFVVFWVLAAVHLVLLSLR